MKNFLKKYWLFGFLIFLVFLVVVLKIFFSQKTTVVPNRELSTPKFISEQVVNQNINYQITASLPTNLPTNLPVYEIAGLRIKDAPYQEASPSSAKIDQKEAEALAKKFLLENGGPALDYETTVSFIILGKTETFATQDAELADAYVVGFQPKINKTGMIADRPDTALSNVWITKTGQVAKASVLGFSLNQLKNYPLRNIKTAQADLLAQKATLVWLKKPAYAPSLPANVLSFVVNKIYLAYFLPNQENDILQPIYVFEGKTTLQSGEIEEAAIYLPAIEEKYLFTPGP